MNVPEFIVQATLVLLMLAVLVFGIQAVRQRRSKPVFGSSFPTILLVVIVGWIITEIVGDAIGTSTGMVGEWAHLTVMALFAACITLQLRQARKS